MAIRSALPLLGGIVALTTVAFSSAYAQAPSLPSARVVTAYPDSSYLVNIGGRNMLAITEAMADSSLKVKAEVWRLRSQLALRDSLIGAYALATAWYDSTVTRQRHYIGQLDSLYTGYKKLAATYKSLGSEPWLTFSGGLGATGRDHKPAVLAGLGIRRVRIWGFLQEANAGGFIGASLRLF